MSLQATRISPRTSSGVAVAKGKTQEPLSDAVRDALSRYFDQLNGTAPNDLYHLVMEQVEQPLFETVMNHTGGNQSRAAMMLGISRSTLRKKLAHYDID